MKNIKHKFPPRFQNVKLEDIPKDLEKLFVANIKNKKGIYIWGGTGIGKTHIAYALRLRLSKNEDCDSFVRHKTFQQIVTEILESNYEQNLNNLLFFDKRNTKAIFIDDLGSHKFTEWNVQKLYEIVNTCYEEMIPLIITSNISLKDLEKQTGSRIATRIAEMCNVIKLEGKNRRI